MIPKNPDTKIKKILIIGGSSFVGKRIVSHFAASKYEKKYEIISTYHNDKNRAQINTEKINVHQEKLDITDFLAVDKIFQNTRPDIAIITSALSSNSYPEELLMKINYDGIKNIVEVIKKIQMDSQKKDYGKYHPLVIFFSTEQIFDGKKVKYTEKDIPNPINSYGKSKLAGETAIKELSDYIILRNSITFGLKIDNTDHDTFVTKIIDKSNLLSPITPITPLQIFNDVYRAPIYVNDIPVIIEKLIDISFRGIINVSGREAYNYEQMYNMIKQEFNIDRRDNIVKCSIDNIPKRLVLDSNFLENTIEFKATGFFDMLKKMKAEYSQKS